jgi:hypothetical protein
MVEAESCHDAPHQRSPLPSISVPMVTKKNFSRVDAVEFVVDCCKHVAVLGHYQTTTPNLKCFDAHFGLIQVVCVCVCIYVFCLRPNP